MVARDNSDVWLLKLNGPGELLQEYLLVRRMAMRAGAPYGHKRALHFMWYSHYGIDQFQLRYFLNHHLGRCGAYDSDWIPPPIFIPSKSEHSIKSSIWLTIPAHWQRLMCGQVSSGLGVWPTVLSCFGASVCLIASPYRADRCQS